MHCCRTPQACGHGQPDLEFALCPLSRDTLFSSSCSAGQGAPEQIAKPLVCFWEGFVASARNWTFLLYLLAIKQAMVTMIWCLKKEEAWPREDSIFTGKMCSSRTLVVIGLKIQNLANSKKPSSHSCFPLGRGEMSCVFWSERQLSH